MESIKNSLIKILKLFTNHEKKLSNCLIILLKLHLWINRSIHEEELKILTPKQMLQRLPITFA